MASHTPPTASGLSGGWTLIETTVALLVISLTLGFTILLTRNMADTGVTAQAEIMMHNFRAARTEAIGQGLKTKAYIEPNGGTYGQGRYAFVAQTESETASDVPANRWVSLKDEVGFGSGMATTGPFGSSIDSAVPLTSFSCRTDGVCELGGAPTEVFYLQNLTKQGRVRGVMISESGTSRVYHYDASTDTWE